MELSDAAKYLKIIRKWWWVIALLFGATVGTMAGIAFLTKTTYEATVTVQICASLPQEVPLYSDYNRQTLRTEIEYTRTSLSQLLLEGDVPWRALERLPAIEMGGEELRERITIDAPEDSQLLRVTVRASDAEVAALLANTVVETVLEQYGELLAKPTANTRQFIERELEATREELGEAEAELTQFQVDNKIGNLDSVIDNQYQLLRSLRIQQDLARAGGQFSRAQSIEGVIMEREIELQNMLGLAAQFNELVDRVDRVRTTYNFLLDKRTEAQIKENQILELGTIQIITPAHAPRKPVVALSSQMIVLGAVVSILTGALLTFLLEYLQISGVFSTFHRRYQGREMVSVAEKAG